MAEAGLDEAPGDLDLPLAPDVVEDEGVARADPADGTAGRVGLDDRPERFVLLARPVGAARMAGPSENGGRSYGFCS